METVKKYGMYILGGVAANYILANFVGKATAATFGITTPPTNTKP
jgi:hypothetical protein